MRLKPALSRLLILTTLLTPLPSTPSRAAVKQDEADGAAAVRGLRFRLSEGKEQAGERPRPDAVAPASPLSEREVSELLSRLPALEADPADAEDFKLRERTLPPPRAGETIRAAFAPPGAGDRPPGATDAPLRVVRVAPEGEVALAPAVSVTFSQPMVAVASQEEAAANVPVTLTPQPRGSWRWLGTQTLVFQPEAEGGRLPMATAYTLHVPAGAKSALGNSLAQPGTVSFSTPPLTLKHSFPSGLEGRPRDALMFMEFDQRIDAARLLERVKVPLAAAARLRLATPEEIATDAIVSRLVKNSQEGRWFVVRAVNPDGTTAGALPPDAAIKVVVPPGTPSAEGPRTTTAEQSFSFKTHGALRVTQTQCGFQRRCAPSERLAIDFSNPIDAKSFRPSQVSITPEIPGADIFAQNKSINIEGATRGNTTYTVTLDRSVKDEFGQTLTGRNQVTFKVNASEPILYTAGDGFVVLDPAGRRALSVYSANYRRLKVSLYKVGPEDWPRFRTYQGSRYDRRGKETAAPPGRLVFDGVVAVKAAAHEVAETPIDLSPALTNGFGQVFVRVEPVEERDAPARAYAHSPDGRVETWVQVTEMGVDAFADKSDLVVWANSLKDGRPLAGVSVSVAPESLSGTTDADGLARFALRPAPASAAPENHALVVARRGDDVAILPQTYSPYSGGDDAGWRRADPKETLAWYVFDDRKMYRPGEEVNVKGWVRLVGLTPKGDTELPAAGQPVSYVLRDSRGNELTKGGTRLNALAGFDLKLQLPAKLNLGPARLELELGEGRVGHMHIFLVEEFRRPEFEVTARASEAPHFVGAHATVTTTAAYYAGGALADTEVRWTVVSSPTNYTPPNRGDYTFGKFVPWWGGAGYDYGDSNSQSFTGRTDSEGRHTLRIDFDGVNPPRPSSVTAQATVQDVNRQRIATSATLLAHPADVYVGLKPARTFVQDGEAFDVSAIVTDLDGRAVAGRDIRLRLVRFDYVFEKGELKQKEADAQEQTVRSGPDAVGVRLATKGGGPYRLTARVHDERERPNESELLLWVAGGGLPPERNVEQERIDLIPDRRTYAGGDVAEILVQSPFAGAEGVLTLRRSGLLRTERFTMSGHSHVLRVPVEESMTPNVHARVDLVGAAVRVDEAGAPLAELPKRPAFAAGEIKLEIPPAARRLSVTAAPRASMLKPGEETVVDVEVKDAEGRAVQGGETAVVVVDESVMALTDYKLDDPLGIFYSERAAEVSDYRLRENILLDRPDAVELLASSSGTGGAVGAGGGGSPSEPPPPPVLANMNAREMVTVSSSAAYIIAPEETGIKLRRNFNALAVFAASLPTDAAGRAQVRVKLPDNLTRYRVMAVSVSGGRLAGKGESAITARLPLMARPSAPRFLNFGDRAELPVVLQNQTEREMSVRLAVRATNAELTEGAGRRVSVPARGRVEVRFPVAALKPGTARFQVAAAAGDESDAAFVSLPVYTPATTEAFATYGVVDEGAVAQPVRAPADAVRSFGGLEVTTASTQLQELTDAVIYLYNYPFECSEQIASRVLAVAALKDVLAAFRTKDLPTPEAMRAAVDADLKSLQGLQNEDGGFDFWRRGRPSNPYVSVHVAHALARARAKGFEVPDVMAERAHAYLRQIESKIPADYSREAKHAIRAYAIFTRSLLGDRDGAGARKLVAEAGGVEKLSLESLGWLLPVLSGDAASAQQAEAVRRHLNNRVTETAGAAHFADSYADGEYTILHSDRRADGVLLDALIGDQPQSDLIPKLVRGLLGHRERGRWTNTQENVFILLALDRYFQTYERATPDFLARVWLGQSHAGEQTFRGRSADRQQLNLPMTLLAERTASAPVNLTIGKEGAGRLYFRIGTQYAPSNLKLAAADYGFRVERQYEAVDDAGDVRRDAEGVWHIRAGARVRVRVRMSNPARRYHVALVDPLPAGLEALNPALSTTESLPRGETPAGVARGGRGVIDHFWYWRGPWYEHQNLRDERAEAFTSLLWEGEHEYSYFARATTPGQFVVPPPKAEEMYSPETFGRGHSDRVRVE